MFSTNSKGQGFDLPVVKRMTEAIGGTLTFESQEDKGTKFMRLPCEHVGTLVGKLLFSIFFC
jgi:signal transduction histidine kinase